MISGADVAENTSEGVLRASSVPFISGSDMLQTSQAIFEGSATAR